MRVVEVGREPAHARIAGDPRVAEIVDVVRQDGEMLALVLHAIRYFHTEDELRFGPRGAGTNLRKFLDLQMRKGSRPARRLAEKIAVALEGLYRDEDEGNVRGTLLEALVEDRLRGRYASSECLLTNNLLFHLA